MQTLHKIDTEEELIPLFTEDVRLLPPYSLALMCSLTRLCHADRRLEAEKQHCHGPPQLLYGRLRPGDGRHGLLALHREESRQRHHQGVRSRFLSSSSFLIFALRAQLMIAREQIRRPHSRTALVIPRSLRAVHPEFPSVLRLPLLPRFHTLVARLVLTCIQ